MLASFALVLAADAVFEWSDNADGKRSLCLTSVKRIEKSAEPACFLRYRVFHYGTILRCNEKGNCSGLWESLSLLFVINLRDAFASLSGEELISPMHQPLATSA